MPSRERTTCRRCKQIVEISDKGISVFMFCQTIGVKPRRKSPAPTMYFCPTCVMVVAVHPGFEEWDCFNFAAHSMIRNLVGAHRPETQAAIGRMFGLVIEREGRISDGEIIHELRLPEVEILPPERRLREAS